MRPIRLGVLCDLREEQWPSMDLYPDMLLAQPLAEFDPAIEAHRVCPPMRKRLSLGIDGGIRPGNSRATRARINFDRLVNRMWDYPRYVRGLAGAFDVFHLVDHSYGQLVHELPAGRTVVTCHDLDTFRCVIDPTTDPRGRVVRAMARRALEGLRRAAIVACVSETVRSELAGYELVPEDRLRVVHPGIHPACSATEDAAASAEADRLLGPRAPGRVELLHVGSTIERKRIDVLLRAFARMRQAIPGAELVRVGGEFTREQEALADRLGVRAAIRVVPFVERPVLTALYQRAALVLQPSEREGFGLPVAEALACGTPVLASDLAVLREVAGGAGDYAPVGDVRRWGDRIVELLHERAYDPAGWADRRTRGLDRARELSWYVYARRMAGIYEELVSTDAR